MSCVNLIWVSEGGLDLGEFYQGLEFYTAVLNIRFHHVVSSSLEEAEGIAHLVLRTREPGGVPLYRYAVGSGMDGARYGSIKGDGIWDGFRLGAEAWGTSPPRMGDTPLVGALGFQSCHLVFAVVDDGE